MARGYVAQTVRKVLEDPVAAGERRRAWARRLCQQRGLALADREEEETAVIWLLNLAGGLPEHEDATLSLDALLDALPAMVRLPAEGFYLPQQRLEQWGGGASPQQMLELLRAGIPDAPEPLRNEHEARPNDPCPCGSGKKHKRCSGLRGHAPLKRRASTAHG